MAHCIENEALRFIPARAGNTMRIGALIGRLPVHPRAGGEHVLDG